MSAGLATLGIEIDSRPAVDAASALDKLAEAAGRGEGRVGQLKSASDDLVAALRANTGATTALTAQLASIEAAGGRAQQSLATVATAANTTKTATTGLSTAIGFTTSNVVQFTGASNDARTRLDALAAAAKNAAAGWKELGEQGRTASLNIAANDKLKGLGAPSSGSGAPGRAPRPDELRNLAMQGGDILSSAASGGSLSTIALQQGPQIAQVFGPGGASVGGVFKAAGDSAASLAARVGLLGGAIGGVTAIALAGVAAGLSYANTQREVQKSLTGIGAASGATASQINAIAMASAASGNISTREARSMAAQFASTGKIGTEMYAGLIGSAKDYAATTGQDLSEATGALASAFSDPSQGAEALNKQLGFLNATTQESVQRLQAQGDRLGAQRVLFDAYKTGLTNAADLTTAWARVTAATMKPISDFWDELGRRVDKVTTGGSLEDQIDSARKVLAESQALQQSGIGRVAASIFGQDPTKDAAALQTLLDKQAAITARGVTSQQNQRSLQVSSTIRSLNPEQEQLKNLEDKVVQLRTAITQPVTWGLDQVTLAAAEASFERIARQFKSMTADVAQFGSTATAELNRTAQFNNRTATMAPLGRSTAQADFQFDADIRRTGLNPNGPSVAQVNADFDARFQNADARDLSGLTKAREEAVRNATELAGLQSARDLARATAVKQEIQAQTSRSGLLGQVPAGLRDAYIGAAAQTGLPLDYLLAVSKTESRFNPTADANLNDPRSHAYGPMQLQPGTARELGVDPRDPVQNIMGGARYLRARYDQAGGDEALAYGLYHDGPASSGNSAAALKAIATMQRYRNTPTTGATALEQDDRQKGLQKESELLQANKKYLDVNGEALDASTRKVEMIAAAQLRGVDTGGEYERGIARIAAEQARAARELANTKAGRDLAFDTSQLGRTSGEQQSFGRARSIYGDTTSDMSQAYIAQSQLNDNLKVTKDLAGSAFSGMLNDLRQGTSLASTLGNLTNRFADKLISVASDRVISGLFGGADKSGGGFLSGIASLFGSATLPKLAGGGITSGLSFAGEAGPEAVIPVPSGGRIPVMLQQPANSNSGGSLTQNFITQGNVEMRPGPVVTDGQGNRRQDVIAAEIFSAGANTPRGQSALNRRRLAST